MNWTTDFIATPLGKYLWAIFGIDTKASDMEEVIPSIRGVNQFIKSFAELFLKS